MAEIRAILFDEPGEQNTDATLAAAAERMKALGIKSAVVATSTGATTVKLARLLEGTGARTVGVTLQAGVWQKYCPPDPGLVAEAEKLGARIFTGTHALMGNVDTAIREKFGGICATDLIAFVYYTFSQGTKVAVEVACMACDAGMVPMGEEAVAIAGTGGGADTALVLTPTSTNNFFDVKIHEVLAMPR